MKFFEQLYGCTNAGETAGGIAKDADDDITPISVDELKAHLRNMKTRKTQDARVIVAETIKIAGDDFLFFWRMFAMIFCFHAEIHRQTGYERGCELFSRREMRKIWKIISQ